VIFVDTSALYALLDRSDANHGEAGGIWQDLLERREPLVTHNYVVVEAVALVQRRLGMGAVRTLVDDVLGVVRVLWVDEVLHHSAVTALLASGKRDVSLVDRVSFELMQRQRVDRAFAFDEDFVVHGFTAVPPLPEGDDRGGMGERASAPNSRRSSRRGV
jgi:predicted nucleic acid-binding protein